jgi:hypothetical protein
MIRLGLIVLGIFLCASQAAAVTYVFDMPVFTGGSPESCGQSLAGQTSILEVTVDNGSAETANQTYLNSQILALKATVGARSVSLNSTDHPAGVTGSAVYISTDSADIPTLDLTTSADTAFDLYRPGSFEEMQLGTGAFSRYLVVIGCDEGSANQVTTVVGSLAVPEPSTETLGLAALSALALIVRARNQSHR